MDDANALEDSYLRNWLADLRSASVEARALFDELSDEQLAWKPAPKIWSVAECFAHLVASAELYHPRIAEALDRVRDKEQGESEKGEQEPFKARWLQRRFIAFVGPQSRSKLKAPKKFVPAVADVDVARVASDFFARQEELGELIRKADGCDLNRGKIVSPILRLLNFTLGEAFWMLTAHAQRHLLQAQRLRRTAGFPGA